MFYTLIKHRRLTNQSALGPIYVIIEDITQDYEDIEFYI